MNFPPELPFSSFLQYSPKGLGSAGERSKNVTHAIKSDGVFLVKMPDGSSKSMNAIDTVAGLIERNFESHPFLRKYFGPDVTLIPMPRSTPLASTDSLWPTHRICRALVANRHGGDIAPVLERFKPVPKSAFAAPGERPGPQAHYDSTRISQGAVILGSRRITLIDDVVTRGASFVGMVPHLREAFPGYEINCFAVVRTQSYEPVEQILAPVEGTISFDGASLRRVP